MKEVFISRTYPNTEQSLGALSTEGFSCKTIELPWKQNKNNISCIPPGTYLCKWTKSPRMSKEKGFDVFTYEVMDVVRRAGIRIHPANYSRQLLGCIALGDSVKDLDLDGLNDVAHSGDTCKKFNEFMKGETFKLTIK